eukprot:SAG22_NODE_1430_length_4441_cov_2.360894_5_plen_85_part_01
MVLLLLPRRRRRQLQERIDEEYTLPTQLSANAELTISGDLRGSERPSGTGIYWFQVKIGDNDHGWGQLTLLKPAGSFSAVWDNVV